MTTTTYAGTTGQSGNMFDVQAVKMIELKAVSVNLDAGSHTVNVYYRQGTHVGFEQSAAARTLVYDVCAP